MSTSMSTSTLVPSKRDLVASLVVFIVAVPLSLGIALASGASLASGLIAAAIGGIVVGGLSGAPLAASGPAAGLTVLVYEIIQRHGIAGLAVVTVLCGLAQIAMGLARAGKLFTLVPRSVLHGMLAAIGAIIMLGQLHVLMGAPVPKSPVAALTGLPASLAKAVGPDAGWIAPVFACGLVAVVIQVLWMKYVKGIKWMPAALVAVLVVTPLSLLWPMSRVALEPLLPIASSSLGTFASLDWLPSLGALAGSAVGLTLVASAESLLTARAVDLLVPGGKPARLNKELIAQGSGNFLSGLLGGLPITAVIVRSAANINAGAQSRWSVVLHGAWVLLFAGLLAFVLEAIPLTALAAVLVVTGARLLNLGGLVKELRHDRVQGAIWVLTMGAIMVTNLLVGLGVGLGAALLVRLAAWAKVRAGAPRLQPQEITAEWGPAARSEGPHYKDKAI